MNSTLEHQAESVIAMSATITKPNCCEQCEDGCMCADMSACSHRSVQASTFIVAEQYFYHGAQLSLTIAERLTFYHSLITSLDIRPPVV